MTVKLLTEHNLEFLSLKGGDTGWSNSTLVKMSYCWKSNVMAHFIIVLLSNDKQNLTFMHLHYYYEPKHVLAHKGGAYLQGS